MCYSLPLHKHDEDTEWILNRDKKHKENCQKLQKKTITKTKFSFPNELTIHTSYKFKNWNICFNPEFFNTKRNIKKVTTIPKRTISDY